MFPNWVQRLSQAIGVVEKTIENRIFRAFFASKMVLIISLSLRHNKKGDASHLLFCCGEGCGENPVLLRKTGFAYPDRSSTSLLVRRREWVSTRSVYPLRHYTTLRVDDMQCFALTYL